MCQEKEEHGFSAPHLQDRPAPPDPAMGGLRQSFLVQALVPYP